MSVIGANLGEEDGAVVFEEGFEEVAGFFAPSEDLFCQFKGKGKVPFFIGGVEAEEDVVGEDPKRFLGLFEGNWGGLIAGDLFEE
ncbi:MAG: hypothetical protein S4CHLAM102_11280 [Chlamydiia bacterium]|nr:hypothetical protein [Chlamydiia bacterium]